MTTTDTRAALDAAILKYGGDAATSYEFHARPPDDRDLNAAITAHVEAEVARRLAAAPSVEEAIRTFGLGAYSPGEPSAPDSLAAAQIWIEIEAYGHAAPLRAAIAADQDRAIRDHDATWQAHDLERDAEVARWQGEAHALVRAVKSIAAAVGAPDVEGGDGWAERAAAAVIGKATRPTPDEARRLVGEFAGAHGAMVAHLAGMTGPESGEDVAARAESTRTALLRALGVEA